MPCFRPLKGYESRQVNADTGKRSTVWAAREGLFDRPRTLSCGKCRFCRLEYSRQWAIRAAHEASLYERNCFVTLTYSPEFLPENGSIVPDHAVDFMRALRERYGEGIRSFGCAEYGEQLARPHYHLCLFNFDFSDRRFFKNSSSYNGVVNRIDVSESLSELWPFGHASVGELSFESAAYVARYVTKKLTAPTENKLRESQSPEDMRKFAAARQRLVEHYGARLPERAVCVSRMPGLGREWIMRHGEAVYRRGFLVLRGKKFAPPKYYDRVFSVAFPGVFGSFQKNRSRLAKELSSEIEQESAMCVVDGRLRMPRHRLSVMEDVQEMAFTQLKRGYEYE